MLATQRQHRILQELDAEGTVRAAALADLLRVSEMTVRRDIDALDAEGLLLRVHGGATRASSSFSSRSSVASVPYCSSATRFRS